MQEESAPWQITRLRGEFAIAWYETREDGTRHRSRHSLGTADPIEAKSLARTFWRSRSAGGYGTTGQIVEAWISTHGHLAAAARNRDAWKAAKPFWSGLRPATIDEQVCRAYLLRRARAVRTVRYEIEIIRRAYKWAHEAGNVAAVPRFWFPPLPDREVRALTKQQFRSFLDACHAPHVRLFCQLAVATGGRATAILELCWDQIDFGRRLVMLNRPGRVQSHKRRATVPMNDQLFTALMDARAGAVSEYVIEHGGGQIGSIKKGLRLTSERAGLKVTAHMFRHSAAVWMAEAGRPMAEIAQYLGHEDTRTTERVYARFSPDFLRGAAKALEW